MTERVLGPAGSPRRRRTWLLPLAAVLAVGLLYVGGAGASPAAIFELDGNTADVAGTPNLDDWQNLYNGGGAPAPHGTVCTALIVTNCFDTFALTADLIGKEGDTSYFTGGGSKDRNDIPQWNWGANDQSPDKNDITNAFAAAYRDDNSLVLAFGADRHAINGDAQMGFWFNQAPMCLSGGTPAGAGSNCPASTPNQGSTTGKFVDPATGALAVHQTGDILAVVNFDNGGNIGTQQIYRWNAVTGQAEQVLATIGQDCTNTTYPSNFCTTSNKAPLVGQPPWPYNAKGGGADDDYDTSAFIEGFIDLGSISGAGTCFPSFLAETRSSSGPSSGESLDATLKDFALKAFQLCQSGLVTTPKDNAGVTIPPAGVSITTTGSIQVKDEAAVTVSGITTWSGTVRFWLCGPIAAPATCTSGGTEVTAAPNSPVPVSNANPTVLSPAATVTSAGRYCWRGFFDSNTAGVDDRTDSTAGECFTVNPVTPNITTEVPAATVSPGAMITDKAFLTGTANQPGTPVINPTTAGAAAGGTITFRLYGPTATATPPDGFCVAANLVFTSNPVTVSGDRASPLFYESSPAFTVTIPGYYHWIATYSGNLPNTNGDAGLCGDANETVQVLQIPTNIKTKQSWFPNDTATVSATTGNLGAGGSVVFTLYSTDDCTGAVLYTETESITGGTPSQEVGTSNTTVAISTDYADVANSVKPGGGEVYSWKVVYTPAAADTGHTGKQSACSAEHFTITYTNDNGPGTNLPTP